MVKKIALVLVMFILVGILPFPSLAAVNTEEYDTATVAKILEKTSVLDMKAKSFILMDSATGNIILEKNSHEELSIASITKIMSMLLVMEAVDSGKIKLEDKVMVSEQSAYMGGSQVYLKAGEEFTVAELLKAVAIHSANDATVALAEHISGSEEVFVAAMNEKAKALGMNETNFLDCTGLTAEGHYCSAYDVALMSRELITKHPKILEFTSIWHDTFRNGTFSLDNTNKLIRYYQGTNGLKTGFLTKSGYCLSVTVKRNNLLLISVVLGEPDSNTRFAEARKLLDYGFANYELTQLNYKGEEVGSVTVAKGLKTTVKAVYGEDVRLLVNKSEKGKISREIKLDEMVTAPIEVGQKIGEVVFNVNDREIGRVPIVAESKVEKASFMSLFIRMVATWFGIGRK